MDHSKTVIHPPVHLHSKIPLVVFGNLVHFRVDLNSKMMLESTNAAFTQHQARALQVLVHFLEHGLAEVVLLQK